MFNKIRLLIVCFLLSAPFHAQAGGDHVGNGGDGVVCAGKYYFYDLYELEKVEGQKAHFRNTSANPYELVENILKRQSEYDLSFTTKLFQYLADFQANFELVSELEDVDDNPGKTILQGCELFQAAISYPINSNKWAYLVDKAAWDNYAPEDKAALILHEIIYRLGSELGHTTSASVKKINKVMMAIETPVGSSCTLLHSRQVLKMVYPGEKVKIHGEIRDVSRVYYTPDCKRSLYPN